MEILYITCICLVIITSVNGLEKEHIKYSYDEEKTRSDIEDISKYIYLPEYRESHHEYPSYLRGRRCSNSPRECRSSKIFHLSSATCRLLRSLIVLNKETTSKNKCSKYCCLY